MTAGYAKTRQINSIVGSSPEEENRHLEKLHSTLNLSNQFFYLFASTALHIAGLDHESIVAVHSPLTLFFLSSKAGG
jgi:hypothetical protein